MWQSHTFDPASLPAGAGIPAFPAQHPEKTHYGLFGKREKSGVRFSR
jgi:hypothetical protein